MINLKLSLCQSSSSTASQGEADGSLSITSNMQKLTSGKHHIPPAFIYPAITLIITRLTTDSFTEARDTFYSGDSASNGNSKELIG